MKSLFITVSLVVIVTAVIGQANTTLSNLVSPTSINQDLLPNSSGGRSLGSYTNNWGTFFISGTICKGSQPFLHNRGIGNTFLGINAGKSFSSGNSNTIIGDSALYASTSSYYNTAVGYMTLTKTSGGSNTALGWSALRDNTTGVNNTALGYGSLMRNSSGSVNVAIGNDALIYNSTGSDNVAIGMFSLLYNNANYNTAVGQYAMYNNGSGAYSTGIGMQTLYNTRSSQFNTAIGYRAGYYYDNGYNNVFVGANTDVNGPGYYNVIAIGQSTVCTQSSQVTMGNSATGSYRAYANWSNISDGRYKKNVKDDVPGLSFINKLRPVTYNLDAAALNNFLTGRKPGEKEGEMQAKTFMDKALKEKQTIVESGFIAQDVEKAAKEVGYNFSGVDAAKNDKDVYGLRYAEFVVPLVKAVQELSKKNDALQTANEAIKSENETLKARLDKIEQMLATNRISLENISGAYLQQNFPNPATGSTTIAYYVPPNAANAVIKITDAKGRVLKTFTVQEGKGQVVLQSNLLTSDTYQYSLYVNGRLIDSKQMIIGK
jgi:hypothetical protein